MICVVVVGVPKRVKMSGLARGPYRVQSLRGFLNKARAAARDA
jgi:hypothetical protein